MTSHLSYLLNSLKLQIEENENLQGDDVEALLCEIEFAQAEHPLLEETYFEFCNGMYEAKGAMSEVLPEIEALENELSILDSLYRLTEVC